MSIATHRDETAAAAATKAPLEDLYAAHAPNAFRLGLLLTGDRHTAEDLVQDAFVKIAGRFRHLRSRAAFGSYLNRAVVNLARDRARHSKLERRELERERHAGRDAVTAPPDLEGRHEVMESLLTLPYRQRAAVVLRYYQDLSEQQVADAMDLSLPAARSLIARGIETLRKHMRGDAGE
ncbi:MAG: RNA polymerase sigma factor [Actinomycetota bacterium]